MFAAQVKVKVHWYRLLSLPVDQKQRPMGVFYSSCSSTVLYKVTVASECYNHSKERERNKFCDGFPLR